MKNLLNVPVDFEDLVLGGAAFLCPEAESMPGLENLTRQFALQGMNGIQIGLHYSIEELRQYGRLCQEEGIQPCTIHCFVGSGPETDPRKAFEDFKPVHERHLALQDGFGSQCVFSGPILHALNVQLKRPEDVRPQDFAQTVQSRQIEFLGLIFDELDMNFPTGFEFINRFEHRLAGPHNGPSMMKLLSQVSSSFGILVDTSHLYLEGRSSVVEQIEELKLRDCTMFHISPSDRERVRGNMACTQDIIKAVCHKAIKGGAPTIIEVGGRNSNPVFLDLLFMHEFILGGSVIDGIFDAFEYVLHSLRQEEVAK